MPITERSRAVLFRRLSDVTDDEEAVGQMLSSLPHDIDQLATKDFVRAEINAATTKIIVWNITWSFTLSGLILAAVRFTG